MSMRHADQGGPVEVQDVQEVEKEQPTLGGITVDYDEAGRVVHSFRQSTLGDLDICAERGRLTLTGEMPPDEKDASTVGTCVHEGIEYGLEEIKADRTPDVDDLIGYAVAQWQHYCAQDGFEFVKYKQPGSAEAFIETCLRTWHQRVRPQMQPIAIEHTFADMRLWRDDERVINLEGTIDLIDADWGCVDWKTSSDERRYKAGFGGMAWEKHRWAIQPTVYTYAAHQLGFLEAADNHPFTYVVFARQPRGEVLLQQLTVERHRGDWAWLQQKAVGIAKLVEAELDEWPKNDNHALCSGTWCPAWDECKGSNYQVGWPKPSAPAH